MPGDPGRITRPVKVLLVHPMRESDVDLIDGEQQFAAVFQIDREKLSLRFDFVTAALQRLHRRRIDRRGFFQPLAEVQF